MIKFIKELFSSNLTEQEQKVLALKKYNMKRYGTTNSQGGYQPVLTDSKDITKPPKRI